MGLGFVYRVRCRFDDPEVARAWVAWLRDEHLADVVEAGAQSAELLRLDGPELVFEAVYRFADRAAFERYEAEHAPRLRNEGLDRFPLEAGLHYARVTGVCVAVR